MLPVSQQFLNAIRGSHGIVSSVQVLTPPGVTGTSLVGRSLKVVEGSVTLDSTADIRGTIDITVEEPWPTTSNTSSLVPYGTEVAVSRGIQYANGNTESAPLGIYRLTDVEQNDAPRGTLRLTGSDRMTVVKDAKLLKLANFSAGNTVGAAVSALLNGGTIDGVAITGCFPTSAPAIIQWDDSGSSGGSSTPLLSTAIAEEDRYGFLDSIIKPLGKIWYFNYQGILLIKTPPIGSYTNTAGMIIALSSNTPPVWSVNAGPSGVLVSANRSLTRANVYNAVVLTGESNTAFGSPTSTVVDGDPNSVTYFFGPFGQVPLITTQQGIYSTTIDAAAASLLLQNKGLPYNLQFEQVTNPALEPYDFVQVVYPIDLTTVTHQKIENHFLQQVVIGLGSETGMACATRLTSNSGSLQ